MLSVAVSMLFTFHNVLGWNYDSQDSWDSNYCGSAMKTQSPINIDSAKLTTCPSSDKLDWSIEDVTKFEIENDGEHHNIKIILSTDDGEGSNDAFAKLKNNFKDLYNSKHGDYCLDSVHLHWKSEHKIDSKQYDLEAHFVHYSCEYDSLSKALADGGDGETAYQLAVVAVLFQQGASNKFLQAITSKITSLQTSLQTVSIEGVSLTDLAPEIKDSSEYYHYLGSLTTPSCNPIVSWHVLKDIMTASASELAAFATISDAEGKICDRNYRDIQTNTNNVYKCPSTSGGGDD